MNRDDFRKVVKIVDLMRKAGVMTAILEYLRQIEQNVRELWVARAQMKGYGSAF